MHSIHRSTPRSTPRLASPPLPSPRPRVVARRHTRAAVRHVRDVGLRRDERTMLEGARCDAMRCDAMRVGVGVGGRRARERGATDGGDPPRRTRARDGGGWMVTMWRGWRWTRAVRCARCDWKEIVSSFGRARARGGVARGVGTRAMMRGHGGETLKEEEAVRRRQKKEEEERDGRTDECDGV